VEKKLKKMLKTLTAPAKRKTETTQREENPRDYVLFKLFKAGCPQERRGRRARKQLIKNKSSWKKV